MREILFRGQTRRYGEKVRMGDGEKLPSNWVYGGIFPGTGDFSIIYGGNSETLEITALDKYVVYSDTVGQYTGLTDKNGKRIFEGDVVRITDRFLKALDWTVEYRNYGFFVKHPLCDFWWSISELDGYTLEVIDNIHDNPELIGGGHA